MKGTGKKRYKSIVIVKSQTFFVQHNTILKNKNIEEYINNFQVWRTSFQKMISILTGTYCVLLLEQPVS